MNNNKNSINYKIWNLYRKRSYKSALKSQLVNKKDLDGTILFLDKTNRLTQRIAITPNKETNKKIKKLWNKEVKLNWSLSKIALQNTFKNREIKNNVHMNLYRN